MTAIPMLPIDEDPRSYGWTDSPALHGPKSKLHPCPAKFLRASGLDGFRSRVPRDRPLPEIRLIRHVTGDSGVVAEHRILRHRLARFYRLEEYVQVRTHVIPVVALVHSVFTHGFFAELRIVLGVPLLEVFFPHLRRERKSVVAGIHVDAGLRVVPQVELAGVEQAFRPHEPRCLWTLAAQVETYINRDAVIIEEHGVEVGHIAAVFEAENSAHRGR